MRKAISILAFSLLCLCGRYTNKRASTYFCIFDQHGDQDKDQRGDGDVSEQPGMGIAGQHGKQRQPDDEIRKPCGGSAGRVAGKWIGDQGEHEHKEDDRERVEAGDGERCEGILPGIARPLGVQAVPAPCGERLRQRKGRKPGARDHRGSRKQLREEGGEVDGAHAARERRRRQAAARGEEQRGHKPIRRRGR